MSRFDQELKLEAPPGTPKDTFIKNGPHWSPPSRPVMGAILMPQALVAAYKTVPESFQVHHLTSQFFHPGLPKPSFTFQVIRTSDSKNQATRTVHLIQNNKSIATVTLSFIRKPLVDDRSLGYHAEFPQGIDEPENDVNHMGVISEGILQAQSMSIAIKPKARNFEEHRTYAWLRIDGISAERGGILHHCGLAGLTDIFLLDTSARLHNLQLGLGEGPVGKDIRDSPYVKSAKKWDSRVWLKTDFAALLTLNHTVHFHNLNDMRADEWVMVEANTSSGYGGRVMLHSKVWTRDGTLIATVTQEGYMRLNERGAARVLERSKSKI